MWRIKLTEKAKKQPSRLPGNIRRSIAEAVDGKPLVNPGFHLSKLSGYGGNLYKFRVGDYGMSCTNHDEELVVIVVAAGHRKDVYRSAVLN